ncbi:RTA1-like protein [Ephemerocybe angulata]|uniref:RTA1-like protein n=1 Tax=Ephemerocybe angulata TaxID=980116 RepID=A0A8H6HHM9_9AGAR|nr:RTA1-like protein [Tulosesus angulatus]
MAPSIAGLTQDEIARLSPYHYIPSQGAALAMIILWGLSTLLHTGQAIRYKTWFMLPTVVLCGVMETFGWSGRLWSFYDPVIELPYQIQITMTILAPTPLIAATFVLFGRIIGRLGPVYSRLSPRLYAIIFCSCDVISLVVQGLGGGLAASANEKDGRDPELGGNLMLGGIIFQLPNSTVVIITFSACSGEFIYRYMARRPVGRRAAHSSLAKIEDENSGRGVLTSKLKLMLGALSLSTLLLFIRAIYRTIELFDGWNGRIISTEVYFNVLDGAMVIVAIWLLNFVHPGVFLFGEEELERISEKLHSRNGSRV